VRAGISAIASAVNNFNSRCPNTQLVIVGYSQGAQITDNAFCGGPDSNQGYSQTTPAFSAAALNQIKAVIEMGNPRFVYGVSYQVGTCRTKGFSARPSGYTCSVSVAWSCPLLLSSNTELSPQARFKATATALTRTAALATTPTFTKAMARSMAKLLSPLSRAKLATALVVDRQPRPSRLAPRLARAARQQLLLHLLVATALLSGDNVAVKGKQKLFYAYCSFLC
jgi:hypothetical protein